MFVIKLFILIGTSALLWLINEKTAKFWEAERKRKRRATAEALYLEDVKTLNRSILMLDETQQMQALQWMTKGRRAKGEERLWRYRSIEQTGKGTEAILFLMGALMFFSIVIGSPVDGKDFVRASLDVYVGSMFGVFCYILVFGQIVHALIRQASALRNTNPVLYPFTVREFFSESEWATMMRLAEEDGDTIKDYAFHWFTAEILQVLEVKEVFAKWTELKTRHLADQKEEETAESSYWIQEMNLKGMNVSSEDGWMGVPSGHPLEDEWRACMMQIKDSLASLERLYHPSKNTDIA